MPFRVNFTSGADTLNALPTSGEELVTTNSGINVIEPHIHNVDRHIPSHLEIYWWLM